MTTQAQPSPRFPGGKPYAALGPFLRERFGQRVWRIPVDAGFTCPTRDGTRGVQGCLYCDAQGARAASVEPDLPVREQIACGIARMEARQRAGLFIAYFQAYTNTYAPLGELRAAFDQALTDSRVVGMAIGTRPDCLGEPVLDLLEHYAQRTYLWVEIGLQSVSDSTLSAIGRGHSVRQFADATERLRRRGIQFCAHLIFGLPGDTEHDMLRAADFLNGAGAWGVKAHNLYIDKHSRLADRWRRGEVALFERDEYREILIGFLQRLSPETTIHRLMGEAPVGRLLAPGWCLDKSSFIRDLEARMVERDCWQGQICGRQPGNSPI